MGTDRPGRLRTYLGIAPGVGKTYAMLRDGRALRRAGVDTVVAYWERHGRAATGAQVGDLEVLPTRAVAYRGTAFEELDVDGVLARRPAVALVDELAHANLPGGRHPKRWQDVAELLAAGIDVYTTLNVANVESLGGLVARVTGTRRAEPVPDSFVRAGDVKLVRLEPAALRHRLAQGLVVSAGRADVALSHYFRFANLAALQELAYLWLDDSVADAAAAYRLAHGLARQPPTRIVMVAVDGTPADEWLIRYATDLATLTGAAVEGVHVHVGGRVPRRSRLQLEADRRLLADAQGSLLDVPASDVATALVDTARRRGAAQLVIGSPDGSRWSRLLKGRVVGRVVALADDAGDLPVQVVNVGRLPRPEGDADQARSASPRT